jgi:hypothetical protein
LNPTSELALVARKAAVSVRALPCMEGSALTSRPRRCSPA